MEGLEEKLVNMSIFDFCDFLTGHSNNTGIMERLQKFLDVGVNRFCNYLVDHKNNTEKMKKLEEKYLNMSLYEFYDLQLEWKKRFYNNLFALQTQSYGRIGTSAIGIITNILVVATLLVSWKFWRHSIGILLLTLALVDIIGNGVSFIYLLPSALHENPSLRLPRRFHYLQNVFRRLSFLMMIPISANRYALICKPFTHLVITSKKSTLIQITTLTVFVATTEIYIFFQMTRFIDRVCLLIFYGILSILLPLIISFVLTILVIREFRRMNRTLEDAVRTGADSRQGERNVTRTMIAVNVAFIVLILPALVMSIISFFICEYGSICFVTDVWIRLITDVNYYINIFIYTLYLPKFRSTLLGIFKCKYCTNRRNESIEMSPV